MVDLELLLVDYGNETVDGLLVHAFVRGALVVLSACA